MGLITTLRGIWNHPFNAEGRGRALARFVRWQLGARLVGHTVAVPFINDVLLLAKPGMHGATGNFYYGLQEAEDMSFLLHFLRSGDVFHDIGANIGTYSLVACEAGAMRIHAYEPSPTTRRWLVRNIGANGFTERVEVHAEAVTSEGGWVRFTDGLDIANHISGPSVNESADATRAVRLDSVEDGHCPFFIKIDVEGHELAVLTGCGTLLTSPNLLGVLVERNSLAADGLVPDDPCPRLVAAGLTPCTYEPLSRRVSPIDSMPAQTGGNVLFLRDPAGAQARVLSAPHFALVNRSV